MDNQVIASLDGTLIAIAVVLFVISVALFLFALFRVLRMDEKWAFLKLRVMERTTKSTSFTDKQVEVLTDLSRRMENTFQDLLKWLKSERSALSGMVDDKYKQLFRTLDHLTDYYRSVEFFVTDDILRQDMNEFFRRAYESIVLRMSAEVSGPDYEQKGLPVAIDALTGYESMLLEKIKTVIQEIESPQSKKAA
ncbi:MAG: hypothetical protein IIB43_05780 [Candidatus Marinimicrobia bacterium]|nr:hypothetical protein [Candidatus Neomarinimicrobiota bacterium]